MSDKYIVSQHFRDKEFGEVSIRVQANTRGMRARWQGGMLKVIIPNGITVADFNRAFDSMRPQLRQNKPLSLYHDGQVFEFEDFTVTIRTSNLVPSNATAINMQDTAQLIILVGLGLDFNSASVEKMITKMLMRIAKVQSSKLFDLFYSEVKRLGITDYTAFDISHGLQRLGYCTAKKEIFVSAAVVFLPYELQRLIICHELAHLREMNHSPRFHAILNDYMDGQAKALDARLKAFTWPVPR